VAPRSGEYELALGKEPNRFGISAAKLTGEPGTVWGLLGMPHLLIYRCFFAHAAGREIDDYMKEAGSLTRLAWRMLAGIGKAVQAILARIPMRTKAA